MEDKFCEICGKRIPKARLRVLPDTRLCIKCSDKVGSDFEVKAVEENLGSSIISTPIIHKKLREI